MFMFYLESKECVLWLYETCFYCFFLFVESSEPANSPGIDMLELSPTSVLDISSVKSNHLHQLVSEGNLDGVRLVNFDTHSFTVVYMYVLKNHCHCSEPPMSSSLHM